MILTGTFRAVGKHLAQTVNRLALPGAHLVRMHFVPDRDLLDRLVSTQRIKSETTLFNMDRVLYHWASIDANAS